ncbi:MAG: COG1361 family protein [Planctomycetota bacterium]|jgi:hypothetical protein
MKISFFNIKFCIVFTIVLKFVLVGIAMADHDLVATSIDIIQRPESNTYPQGGRVRVRWRITNNNAENCDVYTLDFYAGDYQIGSETRSGFRGVLELSSSCYLPDDIPPGEYSIRMAISYSEDTNPDNNENSDGRDIIVREARLPDIVLSNIRMEVPADGVYSPGDEFTVSGSKRNAGDMDVVGDYTFNFYAGDYLIGSLSDSRLEAGSSGGFGTRCRLPDDIPYGDYTIWVKVSWSHEGVPYENEASGGEITVAEEPPPTPPDLTLSVSLYGYINPYFPGNNVIVDCTVYNIGELISDSYTVNIYAGDYNIGSTSRDGVEPGDSDYFDVRGPLPDDITEGYYTIRGELSCSNDSNSGNNSDSDRSIRVAMRQPTSVEIKSVDADGDVYKPGESIVVSIEIEGVGGQLDTTYEIDVYASAGLGITTSDYKIHEYGSETIGPGESRLFIDACQLPSDIPVGDYYIGIIVTYPIEDGMESKQGCDYNKVYIGGYDLVIQNVEITPGEYSPGEELVVYNLIKNVSELGTEGYAVDYYASTDAVITPDDNHIGYVEREGLSPDQQHSYETTCLIPYNIAVGDYYIGAIITCPIGSDEAKITRCSEETIELVQSGGCVSGQMLYKTRDYGRVFPIRYALVEVYDADDNEDPLDDRMIGRTHTDQDGNYTVVVLNYEMSSQNIYVKVFTVSPIGAYPEIEGKVCSVRDDVFDEIYYMKSDLYPHPGDESVVINMTADKKGGEFMVYDSIIESFEKAKIFFNLKLPEVTTFWPAEEETSYFDPCNLSMYIAQGDRGDRDVIMHEYGHYIADVFAFAQGDVGDDSQHYWNADLRNHPLQRRDEQARNLAFRESWATLFSIATQLGDTSYPYSGDAFYQDQDEESDSEFKIDLEKDTDEKREPGEYYEHMNCCALWDIFDDNDDKVDDDDTMSDPNLSKIWTILLASEPNDIIDFWNGWFASYDDYTSEITRIFQDHRMMFVKPNIPVQRPPAQNTPPVADAGPDQTVYQTYIEGAYVILDGSGSYDPDGDKLTYEWRRYDDRISARFRTRRSMPLGITTITLAVTDGQEYDYDTVDITVIPTDPSTWEE